MKTTRAASSTPPRWTTFASGVMLALAAVPARPQPLLCDFNNAPLHSSLPFDLSQNGVSMHFSATGYGYSIQPANVLGFTPVGFEGYSVYPNSVYLSDLLVSFSVPVIDFSIMYAPEEYACDSSATLRATGYLNGNFVATNTATTYAGTWPTGTLTLTAPQGFDSVVIHYESPPPTGGDWGPIFMADNMYATPLDTIFANGFE